MKKIQWYPGHMTKAMRMMESSLSIVDGVVFILDARCPASSFNFRLKKMAGSKPVLYILNKSDLADERADILLKKIQASGAEAIKCNAAKASSKRDIAGAIAKITEEKRARAEARGQTRVFRFMIAGVPNTGKSTIINLLAGVKRADTGNKAGVTRGKQWISCDGFDLLDTPGTMPPDFTNQTFARRLAYIGSINDDILDMDDIALALIEDLQARYSSRLEERYGKGDGTPLEILDAVCRTRGFLLKGGELDYDRGERAVIDDFRKGRLGRITLDFPEDMDNLKF
ncbi:MAG: ribosome biogenesis GTPase YlqF [Clostridia bacterium]|nr:ribosome biogenesis GTPase YlqF [Clostridia bacterium]